MDPGTGPASCILHPGAAAAQRRALSEGLLLPGHGVPTHPWTRWEVSSKRSPWASYKMNSGVRGPITAKKKKKKQQAGDF